MPTDNAFEVEQDTIMMGSGLAGITIGATNPQSSGFAAPESMLYVFQPAAATPQLFQKTGSNDTDYEPFALSGPSHEGHQFAIAAATNLEIGEDRQFDHVGRFKVDGELIIDGRFALSLGV